MYRSTAALACGILLATAMAARADYDTTARSAYVLDLTTNTVLLDKDGETAEPPASMSKLMTIYLLFEALRDNPNVTLDTQFGVSTHARQMGGSTMFLNERDRPTVKQLIQGIIVNSGNDAAVTVAENLAGSEDAFARLMNERAKDLGMTNSTFANASGWPDPGQMMSMHDLVTLAGHIINDFPEYYGYFSEKEFDYDNRAPDNRNNRNPILGLGVGADGLKTGHTEEAGYGMVGSARQGTRRIVFAFAGTDSMSARAEEGERLINWAFRQFLETKVASKDQRIATAPVWMGNVQQIGLVTADDANVLESAVNKGEITATVEYTGPIEAPIQKGQKVAELVVKRPELPDAHIPLVSDRDVSRGGFLPRVRTAGQVLLSRLVNQAKALF